MEQIPSDLATLSVDLGALVSNWRLMKGQVTGDIAATVKADGYGLGVEQVSKALWKAGCKTFFVATLSEGIELRQILTEAEIYVFSGLMHADIPLYQNHRIHPVLNSFKQVKTWAKTDPQPGAALHVDTGMNRLGCDAQDIETLMANPHVLQSAGAAILMSHLACADTPEHSLNASQAKRFEAVAKALPFLKTSLGNSGGTLNQIRIGNDLARPGIGLYGGNPRPTLDMPLKPVASVVAPILQCRFIQPGDPVGYASAFVAEKPMDIATVGIGYADGLPRCIGGKGHVFVGATRCPILGRVSMDSIIIDISPLGPLPEGTPVDIIGRVSVDEMAGWAGTISYEILTGLGARLQRNYMKT
jgi:alanine racemase